MSKEFEPRFGDEVENVILGAGKEIIDTKNIVIVGNEFFAEMRTEKPRPTGNRNSLFVKIAGHSPFRATVRPLLYIIAARQGSGQSATVHDSQ